jgi:hypothetical protein
VHLTSHRLGRAAEEWTCLLSHPINMLATAMQSTVVTVSFPVCIRDFCAAWIMSLVSVLTAFLSVGWSASTLPRTLIARLFRLRRNPICARQAALHLRWRPTTAIACRCNYARTHSHSKRHSDAGMVVAEREQARPRKRSRSCCGINADQHGLTRGAGRTLLARERLTHALPTLITPQLTARPTRCIEQPRSRTGAVL